MKSMIPVDQVELLSPRQTVQVSVLTLILPGEGL